MSEPTPRPWVVVPNTHDGEAPYLIRSETDGLCVATLVGGLDGDEPGDHPTALANARLTTRAVNSHDRLLAAAKELCDCLDEIAGVSDLDRLDIVRMARLEARWEKAPSELRAAIAEAEGQE